MHPVDVAIEQLARGQCGRFTRDQVRRLAANPSSITTSRLRSGRWRRLTPRVLCLPGAPDGPVAELWTAHLDAGTDTVVGLESAAALDGLPAIPATGPVLLIGSNSHRRRDGVLFHRVDDLRPHHRREVAGLPVTTVERTIVDLSAAGASVARVDAWLDHLSMQRRLDPDALSAVAQELRRPGKRRAMSLAIALGKRLPGRGIEQGRLERALTEVVRRAGLGPCVAQHQHPGRPDSRELADRAFPEARLILEADGRAWHAREMAFERDRRRDREAARAGWQTLRYTYAELTASAEALAPELAAIHMERRSRVAG